jgi:hypothetical protein
MKSNIHRQSVPKAVINQALGKVEEMAATLRGHLYPLTSEDRHSLLKMGDQSLTFVEKTSELEHTKLSFYNSVKQAARDNVSGAEILYEELKKRFVIGRPKKASKNSKKSLSMPIISLTNYKYEKNSGNRKSSYRG